MCGSMVDIQSAAAEIRRGIKKDRKKAQGKNIMSASATQGGHKNSPSRHRRTTLSGYILATEARIDNRKKIVRQQYLPHLSSQYGKLRPTSGGDRFGCLGHPSKFQRVSRLGFITARHSKWAPAKLCGVKERAPPIFGRAAVTLGSGPHSTYEII